MAFGKEGFIGNLYGNRMTKEEFIKRAKDIILGLQDGIDNYDCRSDESRYNDLDDDYSELYTFREEYRQSLGIESPQEALKRWNKENGL